MGMAASQARFLGLTARKSNVEYQGQQINQQRTSLANESSNLYNNMMTLEVPVPPRENDFYKTTYVLEGQKDGAGNPYEITNITRTYDDENKYNVSITKNVVQYNSTTYLYDYTPSNKNYEKDGGHRLNIKVKDNNTIAFEYSVLQSAPANRIAVIELDNIKLDDNHSGSFEWEDDGFGNKGKGTIKLDSNKVIINITDVQLSESAMWGIFNGEVVLTEKVN